MSMIQGVIIWSLLVLSVLCFIAPASIFAICKMSERSIHVKSKSFHIHWMILLTICLLCSIWCLRFAVDFYAVLSDQTVLSWPEEVFNSLIHALQTFSMDEDYTSYIENGKNMLYSLLGGDSGWQTAYGIYASVLNVIAPVVGGAIILEILSSISPKLKLRLYYLLRKREKYYFSELNDASLALAKSIHNNMSSKSHKPVIIFTDAYVDEENESSSEMLLEARSIGAICVRDDLCHIVKSKHGLRTFFLIDKNSTGNLETLINLSNHRNNNFLKKAEIYLFINDDAYMQVERQVRNKLGEDYHFEKEELPTLIPIQNYRNLISNLLVKIPLYEPLIHKKKNSDGTMDLVVSILGLGPASIEMFLSTYWFGQILNCNLIINIISKESEEEFWNQIDYINPEIRHTTISNDPILRINRKGDFASPYCRIHYTQCEVKSSVLIHQLSVDSENNFLLKTDYFFIAPGTDEENLSVANTLRKYIGQYHIALPEAKRTVIAYVIYNSELANNLNQTKKFSYTKNGTDIFMCAVGGIQEMYSVRNVFMTQYRQSAQKIHQSYLAVQTQEQEEIEDQAYLSSKESRDNRAVANEKRIKDDYKYWANISRAMHIKYKMFSMGLLHTSLFEVESEFDEQYRNSILQAYKTYENIAKGEIDFKNENDLEKHMTLMHKMAWLEHRRWNAFTRVKGFQHTDNYDSYAVPGQFGSYKQMELKLHPCLVECDQKGIRAKMNQDCSVDRSTVFDCDNRDDFDLLDDLSYDLHDKDYNDYNFKEYDYITGDF